MVTNIQTKIDETNDTFTKKIGDNSFELKGIQDKIKDLEKQIKMKMAESGGYGGNSAQNEINEELYEKLEEHAEDIKRLNRIDIRMNKELV